MGWGEPHGPDANVSDLDDRRAAKAADAGLDEPIVTEMTEAERTAFEHDGCLFGGPPPCEPTNILIDATYQCVTVWSPLRPLGDRVVVQPDPPESTTAGGLVIPAQAQDRPRRGVVLAVGPGKALISGLVQPIDIHPGQRVAYATYGGSELDDVIVLREDEILGILEDS